MVAFEGHSVTSLGPYNHVVEKREDSMDSMRTLLKESRKKLAELTKTTKSVDFASSRLSSQYEKAVGEVSETYNFYLSMLGEKRMEMIKELEKFYSSKQVQLSIFGQKCQESQDDLEQMVSFMEKLVNTASPQDILMFQSSMESRLAHYFAGLPKFDMSSSCQLEFISNFQAIQVGVRNQFGYVKSGPEACLQTPSVYTSKQPLGPISRPPASTTTSSQQVAVFPSSASSIKAPNGLDYQNNFQMRLPYSGDMYDGINLLDGLNLSPDYHSSQNYLSPSGVALMPTPSQSIVFPAKAQIKRQKMIYHCKFGEFGIMEGQFTEPSGVAVTEANEIIVADTNNHRIQVFDKEGNFKFQFGEVGKREGQLLYPNRVAVVGASGDIVVTERSPTHQVIVICLNCFQ